MRIVEIARDQCLNSAGINALASLGKPLPDRSLKFAIGRSLGNQGGSCAMPSSTEMGGSGPNGSKPRRPVMQSDRYSIQCLKDRLWVVVDRAHQERAVGHASNEQGARRIASLLAHMRGGKDSAVPAVQVA